MSHYSCMKVRRGSSKANYAAKNAPLFCEIWFVNKGKHIWTKEASESPNSFLPFCGAETRTAKMLRSRSLQYCNSTSLFNPESILSRSATTLTGLGITDWVQSDPVHTVFPSSPTISCSASGFFPHDDMNLFSPRSSSTGSGYTSEKKESTDSDSKVEEDPLYVQHREVNIEAEELRGNAFAELLKRKKLESDAVKAIGKVYPCLRNFYTSYFYYTIRF